MQAAQRECQMMSDSIEHLMLEQFRKLDDKVDRLTEMMREMNVEMHAFRHHVRGNELDIDANRTTVTRLQNRIERIERRLELADGSDKFK
jgi:chromosome segregation ATPase